MKKIILLFSIIFLLTGCGEYSEKDVIKELNKKIVKGSGYKLNGELQILNNDEVYIYDISVGHKNDEYYKVILTNKANDHSQVILKNDEGVFILTPSLNKSFKFQSDWPYSNSQIYLLDAIMNDIKNDNKRKFNKKDSGYEFITKVKYPNNQELVKQKIVFDKELNILNIKVYNEEDLICMEMSFEDVLYSPKFSDDYFDIDSIMSTMMIEDVNSVPSLEDALYPLFIPDGTKLANEEKIKTDNGDRVILTFEGDKSFLLVEETADIYDEFTIIPTYGEAYQLMDTLGVMTDTSLSWSSNGIDYYIISDVLSQEELIEIAQSIYALPTISIK